MTSYRQPESDILTTTSPCKFFDKCGGCDFLDLKDEDYQNLKIANLTQILEKNFSQYLLKLEYIWIGPKSRRKITLQIDINNRVGFFAKQSNSIAEVSECFVAEEKISDLILPLKKFLKQQEENLFTQATITLFDDGLDLVLNAKREFNATQIQKIISFAKENNLNISSQIKNNFTPIFIARKNQIFYPNFKINLSSSIFIQATKSGLENIVRIISDFCKNSKKKLKIADIYAGFGAYSFAICDLANEIHAFEGDQDMVDLINTNASSNNLGNKIKASARDLFSSAVIAKELKNFDLAIINPPRNGATPQVKEIAKSNLKSVIYVSCNPLSFAADAKILIDSGFKITRLVALDQFYSTKHLELISIFEKP